MSVPSQSLPLNCLPNPTFRFDCYYLISAKSGICRDTTGRKLCFKSHDAALELGLAYSEATPDVDYYVVMGADAPEKLPVLCPSRT